MLLEGSNRTLNDVSIVLLDIKHVLLASGRGPIRSFFAQFRSIFVSYVLSPLDGDGWSENVTMSQILGIKDNIGRESMRFSKKRK